MATVTYEPNAGALTLDPKENSDPVTEGFWIVSTFTGNGWTELEAFIRGIRAIAWNEGKLQDPLWMANYASLHFSGKALRWHAELPEDTQESWRKLEVAMVARWPPPDDSEDDVRELKADYIIVRAPIAAAASPGNVFSAVFGSRPALVVVKLLLNESDKWFFLGKPESGQGPCHVTTNINEAVRVRRSPRSRPYDVELVDAKDGRGYGWLAIHWTKKFPKLDSSSAEYIYSQGSQWRI
ncbi:hypothetical protein FRC04_005044 [Tulasnella sp. 424]|nr:hypothetical protein FRC04_005044 [Tulasnella sp. 424]